MRTAIAMLVVALLPATALATGTIGIYFTHNPGQMVYSPGPMEMFDAYIYLHNAQCMFGGVEFKIEIPPGIANAGFILPEGTLLWTVTDGNSLTYTSVLNGISPGYNLLCTLRLFAVDWCSASGGTLSDAPIRIAPHGITGKVQIFCWTTPPSPLVEAQGLTSILCPQSIGTKSVSWSAIKSLFE
jgi:hypothetical protein